MTSLPASWIVVGVLLIVITVIALIVCGVKWREAAALKTEVVELRDTMRMMRYEEANLSRMLHTVSKQPVDMPEEFRGNFRGCRRGYSSCCSCGDYC